MVEEDRFTMTGDGIEVIQPAKPGRLLYQQNYGHLEERVVARLLTRYQAYARQIGVQGAGAIGDYVMLPTPAQAELLAKKWKELCNE